MDLKSTVSKIKISNRGPQSRQMQAMEKITELTSHVEQHTE